MLVVLLLISLVTGLVVPRLSSLYSGLQTGTRIQDLENQIQAASLSAYVRGRSFDLEEYLGNRDAVPDGWQLDFQAPVQVADNGLCEGGQVQITGDNRVYRYRLEPPYCRLEPIDEEI